MPLAQPSPRSGWMRILDGFSGRNRDSLDASVCSTRLVRESPFSEMTHSIDRRRHSPGIVASSGSRAAGSSTETQGIHRSIGLAVEFGTAELARAASSASKNAASARSEMIAWHDLREIHANFQDMGGRKGERRRDSITSDQPCLDANFPRDFYPADVRGGPVEPPPSASGESRHSERLPERVAAVDDERGAGHVARGVGGQIDGQRPQVFRARPKSPAGICDLNVSIIAGLSSAQRWLGSVMKPPGPIALTVTSAGRPVGGRGPRELR